MQILRIYSRLLASREVPSVSRHFSFSSFSFLQSVAILCGVPTYGISRPSVTRCHIHKTLYLYTFIYIYIFIHVSILENTQCKALNRNFPEDDFPHCKWMMQWDNLHRLTQAGLSLSHSKRKRTPWQYTRTV